MKFALINLLFENKNYKHIIHQTYIICTFVGSCLNLYRNNCYDVFLSELRSTQRYNIIINKNTELKEVNFAEIVCYYLEKFNEFEAEKTHNKIIR